MNEATTTLEPSARRICGSLLRGATLACAMLIAGCGPVRVQTVADVPAPLLAKMPVSVALFMSPEFASHVHREERGTSDWEISIGQAQKDTLLRLFDAMFAGVVQVESLAAGSQLGSQVRAILEPSVEEYAFVTPRDAGSDFFAVSIKYRVNVYSADGKLADSWGFTGYGTYPAGGLSHTEPLARATALAMRDAGAKLAVEFREQAFIQELLPTAATPDAAPTGAAPVSPEGSAPNPTTAPAEPVPQSTLENGGASEPSVPAETEDGAVPPAAPEVEGVEDPAPESDREDEEPAAQPQLQSFADTR